MSPEAGSAELGGELPVVRSHRIPPHPALPRLRWADDARVLATFAVIVVHVSASRVLDDFALGDFNWWVANIYDSATRWCVPLFVMLTGALLLRPQHAERLAVFYRKRLSRVLIPLVFWSVFYSVWNALKGWIKASPVSMDDLLYRLSLGRPYYHMWYLYMLLGLYLCLPFLRPLVTSLSPRRLVILTVSMFALAVIYFGDLVFSSRESPFFLLWFVPYLPYLLAGHLIASTKSKFPSHALPVALVGLILLTSVGSSILVGRFGISRGLYLYNYLSVTVIPMSILVMVHIRSGLGPVLPTGFARWMARLSLGIYLIHPAVLDVFKYVGLSTSSFTPVLSVPLLACLAFIGSALAARLIYDVPYIRRII